MEHLVNKKMLVTPLQVEGKEKFKKWIAAGKPH
jgi:hypothetical protein